MSKKSLYRIRKELEDDGIIVTADYLYHFARRHRLRFYVVTETYNRQVYALDEDDAEYLKRMVKAAHEKAKRLRRSDSSHES